MIHRKFPYIMLLAAFLLSACGSATGGSVPARVEDQAGLVKALTEAGATVEPRDPVQQEFFGPEGRILSVNGADVQVFEYPSEEAMEQDASQVAEDGGSIGTSMVTWVDVPHFYKSGRALVLYVGSDPAITGLLEKVLGAQFAGR